MSSIVTLVNRTINFEGWVVIKANMEEVVLRNPATDEQVSVTSTTINFGDDSELKFTQTEPPS